MRWGALVVSCDGFVVRDDTVGAQESTAQSAETHQLLLRERDPWRAFRWQQRHFEPIQRR
jgi:hypothetical protein